MHHVSRDRIARRSRPRGRGNGLPARKRRLTAFPARTWALIARIATRLSRIWCGRQASRARIASSLLRVAPSTDKGPSSSRSARSRSRGPGQVVTRWVKKSRAAVLPRSEEVEGDRCYADLASVPAPVETVIIATHPEVTPDVVRECAELGIRRVWMHRSFGDGNVSEEAVRICREHGIAVIPGACPLMFCRSADLGHRCMRWWLGVRGGLPEPEAAGHREV